MVAGTCNSAPFALGCWAVPGSSPKARRDRLIGAASALGANWSAPSALWSRADAGATGSTAWRRSGSGKGVNPVRSASVAAGAASGGGNGACGAGCGPVRTGAVAWPCGAVAGRGAFTTLRCSPLGSLRGHPARTIGAAGCCGNAGGAARCACSGVIPVGVGAGAFGASGVTVGPSGAVRAFGKAGGGRGGSAVAPAVIRAGTGFGRGVVAVIETGCAVAGWTGTKAGGDVRPRISAGPGAGAVEAIAAVSIAETTGSGAGVIATVPVPPERRRMRAVGSVRCRGAAGGDSCRSGGAGGASGFTDPFAARCAGEWAARFPWPVTWGGTVSPR